MLTPTLKAICEDPQASKIMLVISAEDLREFAHSIVQDTIKALKDQSEPKYFSRKELLEHLHISSKDTLVARRSRYYHSGEGWK